MKESRTCTKLRFVHSEFFGEELRKICWIKMLFLFFIEHKFQVFYNIINIVEKRKTKLIMLNICNNRINNIKNYYPGRI